MIRCCASSSLLATSPLGALASPMGPDDASHLLNRLGFGARPADLAEFSRLTREAAIERLLADTALEARTPVPPELADYQPPLKIRQLSDEQRRELQRKTGIALRRWWVDTLFAAQSPAEQLRERMTLFWHNHFVSSVQKVKSARLMLEQNRLLRRHCQAAARSGDGGHRFRTTNPGSYAMSCSPARQLRRAGIKGGGGAFTG
jgi:uncharacterized protein (DUF1800 family)